MALQSLLVIRTWLLVGGRLVLGGSRGDWQLAVFSIVPRLISGHGDSCHVMSQDAVRCPSESYSLRIHLFRKIKATDELMWLCLL